MTLRVGISSPLNKNTHRRTITQTPTETWNSLRTKNIRIKKPEPVEISLVCIATILLLKKRKVFTVKTRRPRRKDVQALISYLKKQKSPKHLKRIIKDFVRLKGRANSVASDGVFEYWQTQTSGEQGSLSGSLGAAFPPAP